MSTQSQITPEQFVPAEISDFIGRGQVAAKIKSRPEDFQVEERRGNSHVCTVAKTSDLAENFEFDSPKTNLVGVTLVKCRKTTFAAVYEVAHMLGISPDRISYAGLKDRWALTSQRIVIEGLSLDVVRRHCCPEPIRSAGWFLKDAAYEPAKLSKGQLIANRFTLNVHIPGLTADQINEYIKPRLARLVEKGSVFPNAYGRQRLGRRQNLYHIGADLLGKGPEAAIRRFLCETSPNEKPFASEIRQKMEAQWYYFDRVKNILESPVKNGPNGPAYKVLNMDVEYKIVCKLVETGSFSKVMEAMPDEFSLWVGAFQSFWFNQALAGVLRGDIPLTAGGSLPLLVCDPDAERFYKRHFPAAVLDNIDPDVQRLFLTPRRNKRGQVSKPWRKVLIPINDLTHKVEDGVWRCTFELRSGGYATTLLGLLFDIDQDDEAADDRTRYHPAKWDRSVQDRR